MVQLYVRIVAHKLVLWWNSVFRAENYYRWEFIEP